MYYTFTTTGEHTVKYTLANSRIINDQTFMSCSGLTSIDIPDSVTSIEQQVFQSCSAMTTCTIGSGVTHIGTGAFAYCDSLTSLTVKATTPPNISSLMLNNNCTIYVQSDSVSAYKAAWGWSSYASRIQAIP